VRWASPWAWLLASGVALPLIAHLWSRRRPGAVLFPTLRFLTAASPVSRRLHRMQDWPLLLLRAGIVLAIAAAAAGPAIPAGPGRASTRALHRVIVVDEDVQDAAAALVERLQRGSAAATVVGPGPAPSLIDEAIAIAERARAGTSRAEIAIVWNGTAPSLTRADLADVPAGIGIRLHVVQEVSPSTTPAPAISIAAMGVDAEPRARALAQLSSLRLPANGVPVRVHWSSNAFPGGSLTRIPAPRLRALEDIADDRRLHDAAARSTPDERAVGRDAPREGGLWLARSPEGYPMLRGWADGDALVIASGAIAASPLSWWSVVSPLEALVRWERHSGQAQPWPAEAIAEAQRDAAPPDAAQSPAAQTRVTWALALALLLAEQWWRATAQRRSTAEGGRSGIVEDRATDAA
jgi:hypothetical protein